MAKMVTVKMGENGPVILPAPLDGRRSIGADAVELEETRFIRGRIKAGDLVVVPPARPAPVTAKKKGEE